MVEEHKASLAKRNGLVPLLNAHLPSAPQQDTDKIIWYALARFANAVPGDEDGFGCFRAFTKLCCARLQEILDPTEDLRCFEDIEEQQKRTGEKTEEVLRNIVGIFHPNIRAVLAWLARPDAFSQAGKRYVLEFLLEHGSENSIQFSIDPTIKFDEYGLFYWKHIYGYRTTFTPAAKFILDKLEQYHERAPDFDTAIPLILCKRHECGKFSVARRKKKDFCSDSCRTLYRQKVKAADWAAYMRIYRARTY